MWKETLGWVIGVAAGIGIVVLLVRLKGIETPLAAPIILGCAVLGGLAGSLCIKSKKK